jgi:group I intron endonuclease
MVVYIITNQENGKYYVGKTVQPLDKYFREQLNAAKRRNNKPHLYSAIRKYGDAAFIIDVLTTAASVSQLDSLECSWIALLDSRNPNIGYNITPGGTGGSDGSNLLGKKHSLESRLKKSLALRGRKNPHLGPSEEVRRRISEKLTGQVLPEATRKKISDANKGRSVSEETRKKISARLMGNQNGIGNSGGGRKKEKPCLPA